MAGTNNEDSSSVFQWDEASKLYYHASSGFYHDPTASWYYSSNDGLYYRFENGNYVLWETDHADQSYANQGIVTFDDNSVHDESDKHAPCDNDTNYVNFTDRQFEGYEAEEPTLNDPIADTECLTNSQGESLPPPSEWLEDTLIELYLAGYANQTTDDASGAKPLDYDTSTNMPTDGLSKIFLVLFGEIMLWVDRLLKQIHLYPGVENDNADDDELEEGEWIPDETHEVVDGCGIASDEDEEEMWRAQYGQAIHLDKEQAPDYPVVDLWDWSMVTETKKRRKRKICRLVGRLIKRSSKLHPSMPSSGRVLKTAPICEVHLDLVRVRSGRVYKLRSPKVAYLASLSSYDSSNPTKDWGFPELSMEKETQPIAKSSQHIEPKMVPSSSEKHKDRAYRDRAAERRTLHGGFGVGPGQKKSADDDSSSPVSATPEEAAAEALNMSFGVGSYARRMLENMGWKEGEALGSSMKGLTEPLQAVGNKGSSGLGWNQNRNWKHA